MAKTTKKRVTQQIRVRNIETGVERTVGPRFLDIQAKPYQGQNKLYDQGVWVSADSKPTKAELSDHAKDIVADAAKK